MEEKELELSLDKVYSLHMFTIMFIVLQLLQM